MCPSNGQMLSCNTYRKQWTPKQPSNIRDIVHPTKAIYNEISMTTKCHPRIRLFLFCYSFLFLFFGVLKVAMASKLTIPQSKHIYPLEPKMLLVVFNGMRADSNGDNDPVKWMVTMTRTGIGLLYYTWWGYAYMWGRRIGGGGGGGVLLSATQQINKESANFAVHHFLRLTVNRLHNAFVNSTMMS